MLFSTSASVSQKAIFSLAERILPTVDFPVPDNRLRQHSYLLYSFKTRGMIYQRTFYRQFLCHGQQTHGKAHRHTVVVISLNFLRCISLPE